MAKNLEQRPDRLCLPDCAGTRALTTWADAIITVMQVHVQRIFSAGMQRDRATAGAWCSCNSRQEVPHLRRAVAGRGHHARERRRKADAAAEAAARLPRRVRAWFGTQPSTRRLSRTNIGDPRAVTAFLGSTRWVHACCMHATCMLWVMDMHDACLGLTQADVEVPGVHVLVAGHVGVRAHHHRLRQPEQARS